MPDPTPTRTPHPPAAGAPSDELVLAAVERARTPPRRRARPRSPIWTILEHLDVARRSAAARHVRARLAALRRGRMRSSARGDAGCRRGSSRAPGAPRLRRARRAGRDPRRCPSRPSIAPGATPARAAAQEIERFRARPARALERAARLLDAEPPAPLGCVACARRGAAARLPARGLGGHCLHEWAEPRRRSRGPDERSDPADAQLDPTLAAQRRACARGRRNIGCGMTDAARGRRGRPRLTRRESSPGSVQRRHDPLLLWPQRCCAESRPGQTRSHGERAERARAPCRGTHRRRAVRGVADRAARPSRGLQDRRQRPAGRADPRHAQLLQPLAVGGAGASPATTPCSRPI